MMTNLFSIFDPSSSLLSAPLYWVSLLLIMMILPNSLWLIGPQGNKAPLTLSMVLFNEMKIIVKSKGFKIILLTLFMIIMTNNTLGLAPYVFTPTSHMLITLSLSLPLWLAIVMQGWTKKFNHMMTHLVPQGTPGPLMPFMVCIETISNTIRPATLAVRLAANMIAGHLLLTILSEQSNKNPTSVLPALFLSQIALLTLETAVAIIQAYVFTILSALYISEV
uniref:ATP synthase subunit a n=1 Tax=Strigamia maritima TaxID=126957 RepID=A0A0C5AR10_STRMM|nr:ATP synthase F0 subunit 6 [Strigamia maritima]AJK90881.1 ATP synthase F0 subunit 6 [Strigamia maritima]